ncbi:MAG: ion transporter [Clostridiales bacterium]|nr:ion transporter [Clostridiales bacterium]
MKKKIFDIIQIGDKSNVPSRVFDYVIIANILLNILVVILDTFEELNGYAQFFRGVEIVTTLFFCVEYILRIWTADYLYPDLPRGKARLRFLWSYDGIVDLFTIIPVFFLSGAVVFRMLRVVRILHLFRINAQYDSFNVITSVLKEKSRQIASSLFIIFVLMLAGSICMYSAEHEAQPEVFKNAFSAFWWSVTTILTIGYGDIYPVTTVGTILATILSFLGVGVVAIPTGIISAGFVERFTRESNAAKKFEDVGHIGEIFVGEGSELVNRTIYDIQKEYDMNISLIMRDDLSVIAENGLVVKEGDILITRTEKLRKE